MAHSVCQVERARMLDNPLRSLLIRPKKLLAPHVKPGMTVLDIGCGPGFFTIHLARMVGPTGTVIAADLQTEMLALARTKLTRGGLSDRVTFHQTMPHSLNLNEPAPVDFAIAFHMVHEVPDPKALFLEVYECMKQGGVFLVSEPKGHVSRDEYNLELEYAKAAGFVVGKEQHNRMEHQVLLVKP